MDATEIRYIQRGVAEEYVSCEPTGNACEIVDEDCEDDELTEEEQ